MNTGYKKMKRVVWVNPASFIKSRRDLMSGPFRRKNVNAFSRLIWFYLLIFASCQGCDVLYRILQKEGAQERDLLGDIIPFEHNQTVEEVQKLLALYGYNPGKIDGKMGARTREAIKEFQRTNDLKETRFVDQATWEKLNIFKENGLVIAGEVNIEKVQVALENAGYNPGKIDGKIGPKTKKTLKKFQDANGLRADGVLGFKTLSKLKEYLGTNEDHF